METSLWRLLLCSIMAGAALTPLLAAAATSLLRTVKMMPQQHYARIVCSQDASASSSSNNSSAAAVATSAQDLKNHAATLQERLCNLHARYSETAASPQAIEGVAPDWQAMWQAQVRQVSATQAALRRQGVTLGAADTLSRVATATDYLETSLLGV